MSHLSRYGPDWDSDSDPDEPTTCIQCGSTFDETNFHRAGGECAWCYASQKDD